jgi:hypothetical protein
VGIFGGPSTFYLNKGLLDGMGGPGLGWAGLGRVRGSVRSTVPHGPCFGPQSRTVHGPVRSTGLHGPVSGEGRTGPPLDQTKARHGTDTDSITVRFTITDWSKKIRPAGPFQYSSQYSRCSTRKVQIKSEELEEINIKKSMYRVNQVVYYRV